MINMLSTNQQDPKGQLVLLMEKYLKEYVGGGGNISFLASQIVYNVDEMIDLTPGADWVEVVFGFGAKQAIIWLKDEGIESENTILKKMKEIVEALDKRKLCCLGLKRVLRNGQPCIVWKNNERNLLLHDMEHFLCKIWIFMVRFLGGRPSKNPKLHSSHLHPLKCDEENVFGKEVLSIAQEATTCFRDEKMEIPEKFQC
jgi:hypothetical protein